jgi:hypothetical protein
VVAEDLLMVLRAIGSGGAHSTDEVLVSYRRGGISRKVRVLHAEDVIRRQLKNSRHAVVEYRQMLADATVMGCQDLMAPWIAPRLQREELVETLYGQPQATFGTRLRALRSARLVPWSTRLRLGLYAFCPQLLAPFFALKRWRHRG